MRKMNFFFVGCITLAPFAANAAGTYYTGYTNSYQASQNKYTQKNYSSGVNPAARTTAAMPTNYYSRGNMQPNSYQSNVVSQTVRTAQVPMQQPSAASSAPRTASAKSDKGFKLGANISRETAQWRFEMKEAGSILHYDNVDWNVFDVYGAHAFNIGSMDLNVSAGFKYGMQAGDTTMVDDDISNGGYLVDRFIDDNGKIFESFGHSLSIGNSSGGNMMGFNIGIGMTDLFRWGNVKFTPSIGYRYFKYKLETDKNYGLSVDTAACFEENGELQCDPIIIFYDANKKESVIWRDTGDELIPVPSGTEFVSTGGTYYYQQPGTSHSYEVEWSGPYVAMEMLYEINQKNSVNGYVELGFPGYTSTGDQPYRFDWQHPKSIEDSAGMFSALHFAFGANWMTALTDMISLSVGLTYDYYTVDGADANTYLNPTYYTDLYNARLKLWTDQGKTEADMLNPETGDAIALNIKDLEASCPGWVCKSDGEIESFYKSMGIRVGINAKF